MTKIKIFSGHDEYDLENEINIFLADEQIIFKDIKISACLLGNREEDYIKFVFMVIYEEMPHIPTEEEQEEILKEEMIP